MTNLNLSTFLFISLIVSSLSFFTVCNAGDDHGTYSYDEGAKDGPKNWGTLSAEWKMCEKGKLQSPIDIEAKKAEDRPSDLKKDYKEAPAELFNRGHAIVVEWQGDAGGIEINSTKYNLVQCHWHVPSEHTVDGKKYDAEIHLVHKSAKDELAVIGCLYNAGDADTFVEKVISDKMKDLDDKGADLGKVSPVSIGCGSKKYFRYFGSLTTPPCSEGVIWTVAEDVKTMSKDQIKMLKGALHQKPEENARPVQDVGGRTVWQFEADGDKEESGDGAEKSGSGTISSSILRQRIGIIFNAMFILSCLVYLF